VKLSLTRTVWVLSVERAGRALRRELAVCYGDDAGDRVHSEILARIASSGKIVKRVFLFNSGGYPLMVSK